MPIKKKNMTSDEPVMFQKRSQNAQPQNEILCSKGLGGVALNKRFVAIWIATSIACQFVHRQGHFTIRETKQPAHKRFTCCAGFIS